MIPNVLANFKRYVAVQSRITFWLSAGLTVPLVLYVFYGVIARYIFRSALSGTIEIPGFIFLSVVSLSLAHVQMRGEHLRIEIVLSRLSTKRKRVLNCINEIIVLLLCGFVVWACWDTTLSSLEEDLVSHTLELPLFPFLLLVTFGFFSLGLQVLANTIMIINEKNPT